MFQFQNTGGGGQTIKYLNARVEDTLFFFCGGSMRLVFSPRMHPVHNRVSPIIIKIINSKHHQ